MSLALVAKIEELTERVESLERLVAELQAQIDARPRLGRPPKAA
jgi:polyhydroxyalkanoate synthesis regulator phasin